ncbi:hypothetical protein EMCG_03793 [[Emmonsia] crescens]|uniref:Uncharacterized protein n=1 Tax=[Emmonsia] crescens TaxID=73230 RepID=A0A0G2IZR3_9EURO|nr:hypothetical protein EMCG_03793 [Emmonsia crescens UAMH 3008]
MKETKEREGQKILVGSKEEIADRSLAGWGERETKRNKDEDDDDDDDDEEDVAQVVDSEADKR